MCALHGKLATFTEVIVTPNIWGYKWAKQCWASLNYATALVDADAGDILADERNRRVGVALLAESVRLAKHEEVRLEAFDGFEPDLMSPATPQEWKTAMDSLDRMADAYWRAPDHLKKRTGVWRDLVVRKRKTEVDPRIGDLVLRGRARGLEMPLNAALWQMIHEIEDGKRPMVPENLRELERMIPPAHSRPAAPRPAWPGSSGSRPASSASDISSAATTGSARGSPEPSGRAFPARRSGSSTPRTSPRTLPPSSPGPTAGTSSSSMP